MSNINSFLDLNIWEGIGYPTVIDKNNYTLFEKTNPEIALIVFYIDLDVEMIKGERANTHESIRQRMFQIIIMK